MLEAVHVAAAPTLLSPAAQPARETMNRGARTNEHGRLSPMAERTPTAYMSVSSDPTKTRLSTPMDARERALTMRGLDLGQKSGDNQAFHPDHPWSTSCSETRPCARERRLP